MIIVRELTMFASSIVQKFAMRISTSTTVGFTEWIKRKKNLILFVTFYYKCKQAIMTFTLKTLKFIKLNIYQVYIYI